MRHGKRSAEFLIRMNRLKDKVLNGTLDANERADVAHVLMFNTTDSACMVKAADNEPVFVLRGKDPIAGDTVRWWTDAAEARDIHEGKADDALHCADAMDEFKRLK